MLVQYNPDFRTNSAVVSKFSEESKITPIIDICFHTSHAQYPAFSVGPPQIQPLKQDCKHIKDIV